MHSAGDNTPSSLKERPRVLLVTQHFQPTRSSGGRLLSQLMPKLTDTFAVEVLTSNLVGGAPHETWQGVKIRRLAHSDKRRGILLRGLLEGWFAVKTAALLATWQKPDVAIVHSSPPFLPYLLGPICRLRNIPYAYIMYDLYPDILAFMGKMQPTSLPYRMWDGLSKRELQGAGAVVIEGRCVERHIQSKFERSLANLRIVHNWSESDVIFPLPKSQNHYYKTGIVRADQFVVQYAGNIGRIQDFDVILGAAEWLRDRKDIVFMLAGGGNYANTLDAGIKARGLTNIVRLPFQDEALKNDLLNACDVSLITLKPDMEKIGVPSKIYPTLAAGVPVLSVLADDSEAALILRESNVGWNTAERSGAALAAKIADMADGKVQFANVREAYMSSFDIDAAAAKWRTLLSSLLSPQGAKV